MSGKYDLRHFRRCDHDYAQMLRKICDVAETAVGQLPAGAERNAGLRKLLEASDCFKRAIGELNHRDTRQVETDNRYGVDPISGQPLPKDSPYAVHKPARHDPGCAINTPPYFPEQCNCGSVK